MDIEEEYILGINDYITYTSTGEVTNNVKIYVDGIETNIIDGSILKDYEVIYRAIEEDMFKELIRIVKIVDLTPPVISGIVSGMSNVTATSFTIERTGDASDEHSGLAESPYIYQISSDGNNWMTKCTNNDTTCEVTDLIPYTEYKYRICVNDKFNNQSCNASKTIKTLSMGEGMINDSRDGKKYKTIRISNQTWFAEDLQYTGNGCLNNDWNGTACRSNGSTEYPSIHYQWQAAMNGSTTEGAQGLCPTGWRIPSDDDWKALEKYLGMTQVQADTTGWRGTDQGTKLKDNIKWDGNNISGFTALPAGYHRVDGTLYNVDSSGYWWSSTPPDSPAWLRRLYSGNDTVHRLSNTQVYGFSVRCMKVE